MNYNKIDLKNDLNNMNDAPPLNSNKLYYCCSECNSLLEIKKIDEELIEFKCINEHNIKMNIRDYLNKIKDYKDKITINNTMNNNICNIHEEKYSSYCFECKEHLCENCLMSGEHSYHYKSYINKIIPKKEILKEIKNLIKNNKSKIKDLNRNKKYIENQMNDILDENIKKIKNIKNKNKKRLILMKKVN